MIILIYDEEYLDICPISGRVSEANYSDERNHVQIIDGRYIFLNDAATGKKPSPTTIQRTLSVDPLTFSQMFPTIELVKATLAALTGPCVIFGGPLLVLRDSLMKTIFTILLVVFVIGLMAAPVMSSALKFKRSEDLRGTTRYVDLKTIPRLYEQTTWRLALEYCLVTHPNKNPTKVVHLFSCQGEEGRAAFERFFLAAPGEHSRLVGEFLAESQMFETIMRDGNSKQRIEVQKYINTLATRLVTAMKLQPHSSLRTAA